MIHYAHESLLRKNLGLSKVHVWGFDSLILHLSPHTFGVKGGGNPKRIKENLILEEKKWQRNKKMDNNKNLQGLHVYEFKSSSIKAWFWEKMTAEQKL